MMSACKELETLQDYWGYGVANKAWCNYVVRLQDSTADHAELIMNCIAGVEDAEGVEMECLTAALEDEYATGEAYIVFKGRTRVVEQLLSNRHVVAMLLSGIDLTHSTLLTELAYNSTTKN